jgi:hypothetical protein
MNVTEYDELLVRVCSLEPSERMRFMEDLSALAGRILPSTDRNERGILELEGLGREVWQNMDAQEYVHQERDSWDG